jgi:hypothetical protein
VKLTWSMRWAIVLAVLKGHVVSIATDNRPDGSLLTIQLIPTTEFKKRWSK